MMKYKILCVICVVLIFVVGIVSTTEYRKQIDELTLQIEQLNKEIKNKESIIESKEEAITVFRNDYYKKIDEVKELEEKINNFYTTPTYHNPVYITYSGGKYHRWGCVHLNKSCIKIELLTAKSKGYTPCKNCW